jgi:S-disulfanyl-L-cysteine oxidoreductase SoxD
MTKSLMRDGLWMLGVGALVVLSGLAAQAQGRKAGDGVYSAEQAVRGAETYEKACASCHMADLRGEGFAPALNGDAFALRWETGKLGDLFKIVKGTMPADNPGSLTAAQYAEVVAFMLKANGYPAGQALSENPNDSAQTSFGK